MIDQKSLEKQLPYTFSSGHLEEDRQDKSGFFATSELIFNRSVAQLVLRQDKIEARIGRSHPQQEGRVQRGERGRQNHNNKNYSCLCREVPGTFASPLFCLFFSFFIDLFQ